MRAVIAFLLLASCLLWESQSVWVKDGDLSFPLQSVKILKRLLDADSSLTPHPTKDGSSAICANPNLPVEFQPVCQGDEADVVFASLVNIITPPDPCEICANVACTGCL